MAEASPLVLISANAEWQAVKEILCPAGVQSTPLGETFTAAPGAGDAVRFFHGGWGKISAAATTQYVIDHFRPPLLVNLGTCGGFAGRIAVGTILLATRTIVYDILEQMGDAEEAIAHYVTEMDLSWLIGGGPWAAVRGPLVSADRDLLPEDIPLLIEKFAAVAADWESGAIAWVAARNRLRCLILRGVTDLVGPAGGEAYGNLDLFRARTHQVMQTFLEQLPAWLLAASF
jgi:adenosylhomocysteine nucleosidase